MASAFKYSLIVSNFNAYNHAWEGLKINGQGKLIIRACDAHHMIILNDGSSTFISPSGLTNLVIDCLHCFSRFGDSSKPSRNSISMVTFR